MLPILIIDCGSSKTPEIANAIDGESKTIRLSDFTDQYTDCSGIIISGAPILLSQIDSTPHLQQFKFLKTFEKPVLGICFGHQILGMTHGATVFMQNEVRIPVDIHHKEDLLFKDMASPSLMAQDHTEAIHLPEGFIQIAHSDSCKVEGMKHKDKPHWGVQFHPEVSGELGKQLLKNFCITCSEPS